MLTLIIIGATVALVPAWRRLERALVRRALCRPGTVDLAGRLERNADGVLVIRRTEQGPR